MKNNLIFFNAPFLQKDVFEICQKVRFNIPDFNPQNLKDISLKKIQKPLYVVEFENLNFSYAKSLFLANQICGFDLVVLYTDYLKIKPYKNILAFAKFLNKNFLSKQTKEVLYSLNINFLPSSPCLENKNLIEVNEKEQCFAMENFAFKNTHEEVCIKQAYFNGNYYFFENKSKNNKKINILIKKIFFLNKYNIFLLKKEKYYYIFDVMNNQKIFVLGTGKMAVSLQKNRFGNYVLTVKVCLTGKDFCVYIGTEKINVFANNLNDNILNLVTQSFSSKVFFENKKMSWLFNQILPQKILNEQVLGYATKAELEYKKLKNLVVFRQNGLVVLNKGKFKKGYAKMWFLGKEKTLNFFAGEKKIVVGGIEYKNCNSLSYEIYKKFNEFDIYS